MNSLRLLASLLLLAADSGIAADDPYGLLFMSPEQRAQLDHRFSLTSNENPTSATTGAADSHAVQLLTLNGTLISNAGKQEVWINGESQLQKPATEGARVQLLNSDRVRVQSSLSSAPHDMKPGQVLDPATGSVAEAYAKPTGH